MDGRKCLDGFFLDLDLTFVRVSSSSRFEVEKSKQVEEIKF